jgi:probable HAF family extracellular repeat protein
MTRTLICFAAFLGVTSTLQAQSSRYILQDLTPTDGSSSTAAAINEAGLVVGRIENPVTRVARAARSRDGRPFELIPGLDLAFSETTGVNGSGDLTGFVQTPTDPWTLQAIRYTDCCGLELLGSLGGSSHGYGINRWGQVAGWSYAGSVFNIRAFVATPGEPMRDLGTLGGFSSFASSINDAGQIAGHAETGTGRWHAFRYTPGVGMQDLGTPADIFMFAGGINAAGQVVGRMDRSGIATHAFRYTDGIGLQDLHTMPVGSSVAAGINDAGAVVGYVFLPGATAPHAFLYTDDGGMMDLNTLIAPGSGLVLNIAWGINNAGEIVGQGTYGTERTPRAFKLTPRAADVTAPVISAVTADPASLWPANLQMVAVTIAVSVTDTVDPAPRCRVVEVTSSETVDAAAIQITGDLTLTLRAERSGTGTGRRYQVAVSCSDASGNSAGGTVDVHVPHDRAGGNN